MYPAEEKIAKALQDTHQVLWISFGPEIMGWPTRRPRMFAVGLNRRRLKYIGPDEYVQDFHQIFARSCALSGDSLFVAGPEEVDQELRRMLNVRAAFRPRSPSWSRV